MATRSAWLAVAAGVLVACSDGGDKPQPDAGMPDSTAPDEGTPPDRALEADAPPATPTTGTIRGTVTMPADIFPPPTGDLAGALIVAAIDGVPMLGGQPVAFATDHADFNAGSATYELTDVPPGRYAISAMLDDNESFTPDAPFDGGDVINPLPAEVEVVAGEVSTVDLVIDTPVPGAAPFCGAGPLDTQKRHCIFDFIWGFAERNYPFFSLKGIDWAAVKVAYEPRVDAPGTDVDFYYFVAELLAELRDGHCTVASASALGDVQVVPGVRLARIGGEIYCAWLDPGSAAAAAGLQVGDHLLTVDGKSFADHVAAFGKYTARPNDPWYYRSLMSSWLIGAAGSNAQIAIERDAATLTVARAAPAKATGPLVASQRLDGASGKQYGYIRIATFLTPEVVTQFDAALDALLDVAGLILDVRQNGGGESAVGNALIARLITSPVPVAKDHLRGSLTAAVVTTLAPRGTPFAGPVAVLIDESSFSNAHLFPSQLKDLQRATLVGRSTGGGSAAVETWQLSETLKVGLSKSLSVTANGSFDEELGTAPDVVVPQTLADVQAGLYSEPGVPAHDVVLQRAIEQLGD